jgi:hypothetical protein
MLREPEGPKRTARGVRYDPADHVRSSADDRPPAATSARAKYELLELGAVDLDGLQYAHHVLLRVGLTGCSWLLHVLGGLGGDGPGVQLADDEVDHRYEVAVGAVPAGAAFRGLDQ